MLYIYWGVYQNNEYKHITGHLHAFFLIENRVIVSRISFLKFGMHNNQGMYPSGFY